MKKFICAALLTIITFHAQAQTKQIYQLPAATLPLNGQELTACDQGAGHVTSGCQVGTLVPTFATMAALQASTGLLGTVYLSGFNTFNDGGQGYFTVGGAGTTDGGTIVQNAGSQYLYRNKQGLAPQPAWFGAVNGADATTTINNMLLAGPVRIPSGVTYNVGDAGLTMKSNTAIVGDSSYNSFLSMNTVALLNVPSNTVIQNMNIAGGNPAAAVYGSVTGNANQSKVVGNFINNANGSGAQYFVGLNNVEWSGNSVIAAGYGILDNTTNVSGNGLRINDNYISSIGGEAIELNTPGAFGESQIAITGNVLKNSSEAAGTGFGIGMAGARYLGIAGNFIYGGNEGFHVEDNSRGVALAGNAIRSDFIGVNLEPTHNPTYTASFTGVISGTSLTTSATTGTIAIGQTVIGTGVPTGETIVGGSGTSWTVSISASISSEAMSGLDNNSQFGLGSVVAGNQINWSGVGTPQYCIWGINDSFGSEGRHVIADNKCLGFPVAFFMDGYGTDVLNSNIVDAATIGIQNNGANTPGNPLRLVGTNIYHATNVGAYVGGGVTVGKQVYDDACPAQLLVKNGTHVPGAVMEGFACPIPSVTISGSGAVSVPAVPLANLMKGTLRVTIGNGGSSNGVMRQADVTWDGTTFTEISGSILDNDVGALTGAAFTVSAATTASFTGVIAGQTLTSSAVTGTLKIGQVITGAGVPTGEVIVSGSGTTWGLSVTATVSSEAMTATDGGMLNFNFSSTGVLTGYSAYVDFNGTYYRS